MALFVGLDVSLRITSVCIELLRHALYEAANSHMRISKKKSVLKSWGTKLAKRVGVKKALVAVARKLAILMHRIWVNGTTFQHSGPETAAA